MRPRQLAASPLYPKIRFAFTDHHGVGGSDLTAPVLRTDRLRAALAPWLAPFTKTSNNQIPAVDMLLAWWYGFALGAERFEHMTRYSRDPLLPRLLGLPRFPSPTRSGGSFRATRTVSWSPVCPLPRNSSRGCTGTAGQ